MERTSRPLMLLMLFTGYVFVYIDKTVIGFALLPIRQEFALSPEQAGYITGIFFLSYALFQVPAGWLNDRLGYKAMLLLSLIVLGLCALLFGWLGAGLGLLMTFRFLAGIGHSGYPSACAKAVAVNFDLHQRTFAQSILLSSAGMAMIFGPLLAVWALSEMGWHHAFMTLALLVLVMVVLMLLLLPSVKLPVVANAGVNWHSMARNPLIWQLLVANICINIPFYGLMAWLPSFLVQQRGITLAVCGELIAFGGVGSWLSSLASGWLVGRYLAGREPLVIFGAALVTGAGFITLWLVTSITAIGITLFITNAALLCIFVTTFTLPMKRFPPEVIGATIGLLNAGGVVGGFIGPIVIGYLLTATDGEYLTAFLFMAITIVLAGVALLPGRWRPDISLLHQE